MSKIVKGVIVGALVGLTAGLALPFFGLVATTTLIGGVTLTGLAGAIAGGAIYGGLAGAARQFARKPSMDIGAATDRLNFSINPQSLGKWVFGETPCASDIVYAEKISDSVIAHVVCCAAHEIDSFGTLHLNDELVTFSGANATGSWAGALQRYLSTGTEDQTALSIPSSVWPADARGRGIAHMGMRWDFSAGESKLSGGIPSRITQLVKGAKVYDPRLDSTRGGDGAHRADDQSTWEYTNAGTDIGANWALIVASYILGYRSNDRLIFGVGINPDDLDYAQLIAAANVCDETVDGKPRYRIGGVSETHQDHQSVIQQLEAAIGGKVSKVGGKYFIWAPNDDLVSQGTITDDDLVRSVGVQFSPAGPIQDLFNTCKGRYIEPESLYQPIPYPEVEEATAITDDGRRRIKDHDFAIVQDVEIAQRVARELIRRSRFTGTWTFAMGPKALLWQPFDVVTLNIEQTDYQDTLVRIIGMDYSAQGVVALSVIEEDASIYDTSTALGTPITQLDATAFDPTSVIPVTGLAVSGITIQGSSGSVSDAFLVQWNDPGAFVSQTEVRFRVEGTDDWQSVAPSSVDLLRAIATPIESFTSYQIEARHATLFGARSPWAQVVQVSGGGISPPFRYANQIKRFFDADVFTHEFIDSYFTPALGSFTIEDHMVQMTVSVEARVPGGGGAVLFITPQERVPNESPPATWLSASQPSGATIPGTTTSFSGSDWQSFEMPLVILVTPNDVSREYRVRVDNSGSEIETRVHRVTVFSQAFTEV